MSGFTKKELENIFGVKFSELYPKFKESGFILNEEDDVEVYSEDEKENIQLALLDAIWTMRWTDNKEAMYAVLTTEEAFQIVKDIYIELDKIGYEIKKK